MKDGRNWLAGCGRKRAMLNKETRASSYEKGQRMNADTKLLERLIGRLQLYKGSSSGQLDGSMEYNKWDRRARLHRRWQSLRYVYIL